MVREAAPVNVSAGGSNVNGPRLPRPPPRKMTGTFRGLFTTGRSGELCTWTAPATRRSLALPRSTVTTNELLPETLNQGVVVSANVPTAVTPVTAATKPWLGSASDDESKI